MFYFTTKDLLLQIPRSLNLVITSILIMIAVSYTLLFEIVYKNLWSDLKYSVIPVVFMVDCEFSQCIMYSCLLAFDGGGIRSASFTISVIVDDNEVLQHGMLIILRLIVCFFGVW